MNRLKAATRRYRVELFWTVLITALTVNAWVQDGGWPLLIIGAASFGCVVTMLVLGYTSGALVVKHAAKVQAEIEKAQPKELAR